MPRRDGSRGEASATGGDYPVGNDPDWLKFDDLNMLVLLAGRERTAVEFRVLLESAGFALTRILPTPAQWSVVEGVRL